MNIIVLLVHGYNVANPEKTVGKFRPYFEELGCLVETFTYGYVPHVWQVSKRNPAIAKRLAERITHWHQAGYKVIIANHSNGAALTYLATERLIFKTEQTFPIWRVLSMHPALTESLHPSIHAEKVIVVHNRGDKAVRAGKWLSKVVKFLIPKKYQARPWGEMGRDGYQGTAKNVENFDTGSEQFSPFAHGHSDEFSKNKEAYFLPLFAALIFGKSVVLNEETTL